MARKTIEALIVLQASALGPPQDYSGQHTTDICCHSKRQCSLVDQICLLLGINLNCIRRIRLPMRRENHDRFGLHLGGDLFSYLLELAIHRVLGIIHDIGLINNISTRIWRRGLGLSYAAMRKEVDWSFGHLRKY